VCLGGIRVADGVDGMGTADTIFVVEFVAVLLANGFGDLEGLGNDFRANAVTGENC
jgi:hypothetical protein